MKNTKTLYFSAKQTNMQSGESHQEDMGTRRILFILSMVTFPQYASSYDAGTRIVMILAPDTISKMEGCGFRRQAFARHPM